MRAHVYLHGLLGATPVTSGNIRWCLALHTHTHTHIPIHTFRPHAAAWVHGNNHKSRAQTVRARVRAPPRLHAAGILASACNRRSHHAVVTSRQHSTTPPAMPSASIAHAYTSVDGACAGSACQARASAVSSTNMQANPRGSMPKMSKKRIGALGDGGWELYFKFGRNKPK